MRLLTLSNDDDYRDLVSDFLASVNNLFQHALQNFSNMLGITIQDIVNQNDKTIGIRYRRKRSVGGRRDIENISESHRIEFAIKSLDTLVVTVHSVRMPEGFGKRAVKSKGRLLSVIAKLKYRGGGGRRNLFGPRINKRESKSRK